MARKFLQEIQNNAWKFDVAFLNSCLGESGEWSRMYQDLETEHDEALGWNKEYFKKLHHGFV